MRLATGLRPGPQGSLHRSPDSIAGFKGAASRQGKKGKGGREGMAGKEREKG